MRKQKLNAFWVFIFASMLLVIAPMANSADKTSEKEDEEYVELMRTFVDTFDQIERNYVKDIDRRELMEAAIKGMLTRLDQYSAYISRDDMERFTRDIEQQFGGIGIMVEGAINEEDLKDPEKAQLKVVTPLPGTPAYKAGVRSGDLIKEIEGKSTTGMTVSDAVKLMKGNPGDAVSIRVQHNGSEKLEEVKIVRAVIQMETIRGDTYKEGDKWNFFLDEKNKIGYLRLTHFSRRTAEELEDALNELEDEGMKGLILDLRGNPGGLLSQATEVADMFVDGGRIVSTKGRNTSERVWNATRAGTRGNFPMAILVNRLSASASEIVSACLQDHGRAVIVGERTWGKGSVQNVIDLSGGQSALKLTTASYYRPSGKNIHKHRGDKETDEWGVMPNDGYEVKLGFGEMSQYLEYRRDRDVIRDGAPSESEFKDRQLEKAVGYVMEKITGKTKPKNEERPAVEAPKPAVSLLKTNRSSKAFSSRLIKLRLHPAQAA